MRRILMTGASGFIGGHLLRALLPQDEVFALGRNLPAAVSRASVTWIEQDLSELVDHRGLPGNVDAIIHLAQSQVYKQFPERARDIFEVNVSGTLRLLEYAREAGVRQFVFASSGGIYRLSNTSIAETDPIQPLSFYLSSKYAAEILIRNYEQFFQTVILRFFFVYGPGQQAGMLVPSFMHKIMNNEQITIEGNPGLRINPTHVTDAARTLEAALSLPVSGQFNVSGDEVVTITDLVTLIASVADRGVVIKHTSTGPDADLVADNSRMKEVLGVHPSVSLLDGLRQTIEH
jgi:UDP-glucose 4-epimerase